MTTVIHLAQEEAGDGKHHHKGDPSLGSLSVVHVVGDDIQGQGGHELGKRPDQSHRGLRREKRQRKKKKKKWWGENEVDHKPACKCMCVARWRSVRGDTQKT